MSQEQAQQIQALTAQLQQLQQYMQAVEEQLQEITLAKESIKEINELQGDEEIYTPLASGIYLKAQLKEKETFLINVGNNITVKKDAKEAEEMLAEQQKELQETQDQLVNQFSEAYQHYMSLQLPQE